MIIFFENISYRVDNNLKDDVTFGIENEIQLNIFVIMTGDTV